MATKRADSPVSVPEVCPMCGEYEGVISCEVSTPDLEADADLCTSCFGECIGLSDSEVHRAIVEKGGLNG